MRPTIPLAVAAGIRSTLEGSLRPLVSAAPYQIAANDGETVVEANPKSYYNRGDGRGSS
jgi:hypothetical protein